MKLNFYLRDKAPGKSCAIRAHFPINGRQDRIPIHCHCTPELWDDKKQLPKPKHPDYEYIVKRIGVYRNEIPKYFRETSPPHTRQGLIDFLSAGPKVVTLHDRAKQHYLKSKLTDKTYDQYGEFISYLERHTKNMSIHDFGLKDWNAFVDHTLNLSYTTRRKYQTHLKTILKAAFEEGDTKNVSYLKFKKSKQNTKKESKPTLTFTSEELNQLERIDFKSESRNYLRDRVVLFSYLGLRVEDWDLDKANLRLSGNRVEVLTRKTKARVKLPLFPVARRILESYDYVIPPTSYMQKYKMFKTLMSIAKDQIPSLQQQYDISDKYGQRSRVARWELLQLHDCRRTYCTLVYRNMQVLGLKDAREAMKLSGHTNLTTYLKYINISSDEVADTVNEALSNLEEDDIKF